MDSESRKPGRPKARQSLAHLPSIPRNANTTTDIGALQRAQDAQARKKARGKSLGPGGVEALTETSANALKIDSAQLRSILKPAVPLTPPKVIPSFNELRTKRSASNPKSPRRAEELLIDFSTPGPVRSQGEIPMTRSENVLDPFSPTRPQPVTTEPASAEEQEELQRKKQAQKQAVLDRRAERRKSMANRRVSFAPEATLHTWSVMEMVEDSTTSSASNSTRRQSSMTSQQSPAAGSSPAKTTSTDRPETPAEQIEEPQVPSIPANQRDLHQKKRRRQSSSGPEAQLEGSVDEVYSSSPSGDFTTESSPVRIDDSAGSDSGSEGDTGMSMDDPTTQSMISQDSEESSTQSSLDERLRLAATQAGTRGIGYDEHGDDHPMEMATATVTHAFQPWVKDSQNAGDNSALQDQENINPFSPAFRASQIQQPPEIHTDENETQDMSMDVTKAVGGIIGRNSSPSKSRRKSVATRRRSSVGRRRSSAGESAFGDETMDFTAVGGGILSNGEDQGEEEMSDEELTMEFTTAVGGVVGRHRRESAQSVQTDGNDTMDMTAAVGGILAPIEEQIEPQTADNTRTAAMEMTRTIGGILGSSTSAQDKGRAKYLMQEETDARQLSISPSSKMLGDEQALEATAPPQGLVTSIASETGSPDFALKPRLSGRSRQSTAGASTTPKFSPKRGASLKSTTKAVQQSTPTKQLTPLPARAETPNKTPIIANITHRGASPKKLFKDEIRARQSPASTQKPQNRGLFSQDEHTGRHTPSVVLKATRPRDHPRRRSSGVGIDQEGYGSPKISEMLDRRESIGDSTAAFRLKANTHGKFRFEDPRQLEQEVDAERAEEERRENGRFVMEQEANEQQEENATLQLREMIESMTPKKDKSSKLKGRKSLALGAAKGLLGKRPAELDMDDEDENSPKRLKAVERPGSPVKKVHLPKPPSKEETTGRLTRAQQLQLASASAQDMTTRIGTGSPAKDSVNSPHGIGRYKDVPLDDGARRPESFEDKLDNVVGAIDISTAEMESQGDEKISLQKFLNMTNIHFIELSTTKRRHTMAQSLPARPSQEGADSSTEAIFAAATTTLPLLELYQHATRELKSYISTGRKIVRSIEAETLAEQPPLFKEYLDARPDVKLVMDNQFRNGKTNARLQSKEGWYTWRTQLVDGLKTGLEGIKVGVEADLAILTEQQQRLDSVVPDLFEKHRSLQDELASAKQTLAELESVDTEVFDLSRRDLQAADEEHASKVALFETLRQQMSDKEDALVSAEELKTEMLSQIAEADRVRQEYRGWPVNDVLALKAKVGAIEQQTGWRLASAEQDSGDPNDFGVALTLMFQNQLRLFFYPGVYQIQSGNNGGRRRSGRRSRSVSGPTAPISLSYAPPNDDEGFSSPSSDLPTEKRFFLQLIRSQLQAFSMAPKGSVPASTLLAAVSNAWRLANKISQEIRLLNLAAGITTASIISDDKLSVTTRLIQSASRIDLEFVLTVTALNDGGISASTIVNTTGSYGDLALLLGGAKGRKVQSALTKEVEANELGGHSWIGAVQAFERWLGNQPLEKQASVDAESKKAEPAPVKEKETEKEAPPAPEPIKRSPLAIKKPQQIQRKALPVPKKPAAPPIEKPVQKVIVVPVEEKENIPHAGVATPIKGAPAIPPDVQEEMMRIASPIRRVGALRRSPI
jgi:kinetochore protein Spc7/SPC105